VRAGQRLFGARLGELAEIKALPAIKSKSKPVTESLRNTVIAR